jgi:hypothetical protein
MPYLTQSYQRRAQQASAFNALPAATQQAILAQIAGTTFKKPKKEEEEGFFGRLIPDVIEKTVSQVGESLLYTIPGLYEVGKAIVHDVGHPTGGLVGNLSQGKSINPLKEGELGPIAEGMGRAMAQDFAHPLRNPGYALMDALMLYGMGAGSAARIGAAGRAVRASRRPPEIPPASPGRIGSAPRPGGGGLTGLPTRSPSTLLSEHPGPGVEPPPLTRGLFYHVQGAQGQTLKAHYSHTAQRGGKDVHFFRTPEGKAKQIAADRVESMVMMSKIEPSFPGERMNIHDIPEQALPSKAKPVVEKPVVVAREADASGRMRTAGGQFASKKAAPVDTLTEADIEIERAALAEPKPAGVHPEAEAVVAAKAPEVKPDFSPVPGEPGVHANLGPGERISVVKTVGDKHAVIIKRGGRIDRQREYPSAISAMRSAHAEATRRLNRGPDISEGGVGAAMAGELPYPRGQVVRDVLHAFTSKPPSKMRPVEYFVPEEPQMPPVGRRGPAPAVPDEAGRLFPRDVETSFRNPRPPVGEFKQPGVAWPHENLTQTEKRLRREGEPELFPEEGPRPLNEVERLTPRTGWRGQKPGERVTDTGKIVKGDVLLSRNPGYALMHNMWLDFLEKNPTLRVGPWGRNLESYVKFNRKEASRAHAVLEAGRRAGITDEVADAVERVKRGESAFRVLDSMNMTAKVWVLYLKPAYLFANIIGQELIHLADHSWSPSSVAESVRIQWRLYGDRELAGIRAQLIKSGMSESGAAMYAQEHGIGWIPRAREKYLSTTIKGRKVKLPGYAEMASAYNKILDTPFRDNAFITEARRHGFTDAEKIGKLLDDALAGDEKAVSQFSEITRRANRNIIDYARMGPLEKRWIRRVIFFYPWFKGASVYATHFAAEHPMQALIAEKMGQRGAETAEREIGPVPSFLQGVFKVGEKNIPGLGKMPLIVNPKATTVLGTPGEVLQAGMALAGGGGKESTAISQYLTPGISAALTVATKRDPFTGRQVDPRKGALDILLDQAKNTVAPLRTWENMQRAKQIEQGQLDPGELLHPYQTEGLLGKFAGGQAGERFLFSVAPYSLNTRVARSRAFAEQSSLASKRKRELLKNQDYRQRYLEAGRRTKQFAQMPKELAQAFVARANVSAEVAAYEAQLDRPLRMIDRLQAVVGLLVRQGRMDAEEARSTLEQMVQLSDNQIEVFKSKLTNAYFGGTVISQYRAALNAAGADLRVP